MNIADLLRLSEAQREALEDRTAKVLVSAGAGSGKTRLLVAYFLQALVVENVRPQDLVAVTFTRKAGAELTSRIRKFLVEMGREDLAQSLDAATIGTIHSLCSRLIRQNAFMAGVDPVFSVIEAESALMLRREVSEQVWTGIVESAGEDRLGLLATHDEGLRRGLVRLYDDLRSAGTENPRISVEPLTRSEKPAESLAATINLALEAARELPKRSATIEKDLGNLQACLGMLQSQQGGMARPEAEDCLRLTQKQFPSRRTPSMEPHFDLVRQELRQYRQFLAEAVALPLIETMNALLGEFHSRYSQAKRERGVLDFTDLELGAARLVRQSIDAGQPLLGPDSRVMIDEFQDTNELQCEILEGLRPTHLLMVGDERQSIYRFRGADVRVFRRRESELKARGEGLHRLAVNYRSRSEIVEFVNRLFGSELFFGSRVAGLEPGRDDAPAESAQRGSCGTDLVIVEREEEADPEAVSLRIEQAESQATAAFVRGLMDDEGWQAGDIAVLVPTLTHSEAYQNELTLRGVRSYLVRGKGYYSRGEVSDVLALLRILINPRDDLSLVTVLRSPFVGLTDDALYLLGAESRRAKVSLWHSLHRRHACGLAEVDQAALDAFVAKLTAFASRVGRPGIAGLIDDAGAEFGYDLSLLSSDQGDRRFANIRKLMRLADEYEQLEGPNLAGFVLMVQQMGDISDNEGSAPTLAEGENVVRIMTVHQAKGLEFPVVVLAGLGSPGRNDENSEFMVSAEARVGVFIKGTRNGTYEESDLSYGPADEIADERKQQEDEEDDRLLYVAMTRAEERLVLVGARSKTRWESTPIGRIACALGVQALPQPGDTATLEGLGAKVSVLNGATITGPSEFGSEHEGVIEGDTGGAPASRAADVPMCPQFLPALNAAVLPTMVSFSSLAAFQRCPKAFYLESVLGLHLDAPTVETAPQDEDGYSVTAGEPRVDPIESTGGRKVGLLVHALLDKLPLTTEAPGEDLLSDLLPDVLPAAEGDLQTGQVERALKLTRAFWDTELSRRPGLSEARKEQSFCFAHDGIIVSGVMDLVWHEGGSWVIVDYKTNALNGRDPSELAREYSLQSCVYSLAALRAGAQTVSMNFVFLERPEIPVTQEHAGDQVAVLEQALTKVLSEIRGSDFSERRGDACGYCSLRTIC